MLIETYIATSVEEQARKMESSKHVLNAKVAAWSCRMCRLDLACRCRCKRIVIGVEAKESRWQLNVELAKEDD